MHVASLLRGLLFTLRGCAVPSATHRCRTSCMARADAAPSGTPPPLVCGHHSPVGWGPRHCQRQESGRQCMGAGECVVPVNVHPTIPRRTNLAVAQNGFVQLESWQPSVSCTRY